MMLKCFLSVALLVVHQSSATTGELVQTNEINEMEGALKHSADCEALRHAPNTQPSAFGRGTEAISSKSKSDGVFGVSGASAEPLGCSADTSHPMLPIARVEIEKPSSSHGSKEGVYSASGSIARPHLDREDEIQPADDGIEDVASVKYEKDRPSHVTNKYLNPPIDLSALPAYYHRPVNTDNEIEPEDEASSDADSVRHQISQVAQGLGNNNLKASRVAFGGHDEVRTDDFMTDEEFAQALSYELNGVDIRNPPRRMAWSEAPDANEVPNPSIDMSALPAYYSHRPVNNRNEIESEGEDSSDADSVRHQIAHVAQGLGTKNRKALRVAFGGPEEVRTNDFMTDEEFAQALSYELNGVDIRNLPRRMTITAAQDSEVDTSSGHPAGMIDTALCSQLKAEWYEISHQPIWVLNKYYPFPFGNM
ncbi:hypothetical protein PSHT_01265 [Puccinia striiformis]|uniref:Uncharacterized protein n=1 Tax=Puccinia striiformis TaxID=27350 RepID=A0A2S4WKU0_9BASI|nr:hypothetical protein PSHT_01265 [Puccinia striiformis]